MAQRFDIGMANCLNELDLIEDDDDNFSAQSLFSQNSPYIETCKLDGFFKFQVSCAINIIHINCRSLKKNFSNVVNLLSTLSNPLTAIALSETWLSVLNQDTYSLPGYKFVSQPRVDKIGGGGSWNIC
jgi:hypothetical protein